MLSMSLETLNIILMCFDGKNKQTFEKKSQKSTATVITKECQKY